MIYTDDDLMVIAQDLRDESSVQYIFRALDAMRQKFEARIAELTPPAPPPIDYKTPRVLVSRGEASEGVHWWRE
jgi:hypothetical protein